MADVAGAVTYTGLREAVVQDGAKVSNIEFKKMEGRKEGAGKAFAGILTVGFLIRLLAMIAAGLLLLKFFRERTATLVESIYQKPWSSLGIGLVAFIVVPIICILLLVVFIGYFIAAIIFVWYVLMIMIAMLMGAIFLGAWIVKLLTKKKQLVFDWQAVVIGVVVLSIVGLIPVVGWILCAIVFLMAFGALINMGRQKIQGEQNMAIISE
jgi:MFS family permease